MIQVCNRVVPGSLAVVLPEAVDLRLDQLQLLHGFYVTLGGESRSTGTERQ